LIANCEGKIVATKRTKLMSLLALGFAAVSAQAAMVTKDLGDVSVTVDESFLSAFSFQALGSELVISTEAFNASAPSGGLDYSVVSKAYDPSGLPGSAWMVVTSNTSDLVITGLKESISGIYSGRVAAGSTNTAAAGLDFASNWSPANVAVPLFTPANGASSQVLDLSGASGSDAIESSFKVSASSSFSGQSSVAMTSFIVNLLGVVSGNAAGSISATQYRVSFTTADATAVPEPENVALILAGLGVVGLRLSRRAKAN
jgi:hypothetical protein